MTYPQMPQAPQSYQQFPQGYPTTPPQNYPQQFPQQFPQDYTQAPAQPLPQGNLSDFFGQPSVSGGPSWSFKDKPVGQSYAGIVERALTNADIEPQTIPGTNRPATYRDGRQKWVMKVPMLVQADTDHPDGKATWYVSGQSRDELVRAMAEAGAPEGAPEPGAFIGVQLVGRKPSKTPGFSPSNQVRVVYRRPEGAAAPTATPVAEQPAQPAPPAQQPSAFTELAQQQSIVPAQVSPEPAQHPPAAPAPQPPAGLSAEQQALLARMTGTAPTS